MKARMSWGCFSHRFFARVFTALVLLPVLFGCAPAPSRPLPSAVPTAFSPATTALPPAPAPSSTATALSADESVTLGSLQQLDDYPLYTLSYSGDYPTPYLTGASSDLPDGRVNGPVWACSLFAALGDPSGRLFGRNFDWRFSPAVLLFTHPRDGHASVSMVDIEYLGFRGEPSKRLTSLSLEERRPLLEAPSLSFDGMNEKGIAVGMAAVPPGDMDPDPAKKTIDELAAIREILDHAATVDEAVQILARYNIDMGEVPIHYLIAAASGQSALVEFYQGEMKVFRNDSPYQLATNFLLASTGGHPQGLDDRYDRLERGLSQTGGRLSIPDALDLLAAVSQSGSGSTTQWSVVYDLTGQAAHVVMGRNYTGKIYSFRLRPAGQ